MSAERGDPEFSGHPPERDLPVEHDSRSSSDRVVIVELSVDAVLDLRRRVLRTGTASSDPSFAQDADPATWHLGLRRDQALVAVSTWTPEQWPGDPDQPALRLRGMAVEPALTGSDVGGRLLRAGLERGAAAGAQVVWANARDTALGFYHRHGFTIDGAGFIDTATGLAHHVIVRHLTI